jgi:hypothetical protein
MLYAAKCFWPGASEPRVRAAASAAAADARGAAFAGALYLPGDELVLGLFESASSVEVKRASELAGLPCERVIECVWVTPRRPHNHASGKGA